MRSIPFFLCLAVLFCLNKYNACLAQDPTDQGAQNQPDSLPSIEDISSENAERFLVLEKRGKVKRIRYYIGSEIQFKLKNDPTIYSPIIEDVRESSLIVFDTEIPLSEIEYVILNPRRPLIKLLSRFFIIGGLGYFLIDLANNSFSTTKESVLISSSFAAAGLALKPLLVRRKLKLNKNRYLKTLIKNY